MQGTIPREDGTPRNNGNGSGGGGILLHSHGRAASCSGSTRCGIRRSGRHGPSEHGLSPLQGHDGGGRGSGCDPRGAVVVGVESRQGRRARVRCDMVPIERGPTELCGIWGRIPHEAERRGTAGILRRVLPSGGADVGRLPRRMAGTAKQRVSRDVVRSPGIRIDLRIKAASASGVGHVGEHRFVLDFGGRAVATVGDAPFWASDGVRIQG
mmetsp:Transcript_36622/g.88262  ORF Transcript_36622/g.88262 Transcript_36622/m.88262 type:complete len:211 (-) Transcript_36622:154-786(-)